MQSELRWVDDIGMFAIDRSRTASCVHRTSYCDEHCYNNPIEVRFHKTIPEKDNRNDIFWDWLDGKKLNDILNRKRKPTNRLRLCTRGEPLSTTNDVFKVLDFAIKNPGTQFWVPTRGWRDPLINALIKAELWDIPNISLLASIDPSNDDEEVELLKRAGWNTMFFGDDDKTDGCFKCPKTHKHLNGHCDICKAGCFNKRKRVDVHLKEH